MDQFVGHQPVAAEIQMGGLVMQGSVSHGGGADVLHAAPHEIGDGGLGVLFIGIIDADHRRIILHHIGGAAKGSFHQVLITGVHVVQHRDAAPFVPHLGEITHYQRNQVGYVGHIFPPVIGDGALSGILFGRQQLPIGDGQLPGRHSDDHLGGGQVVGEIVTRKPVVVFFLFALAPDLIRFIRVGLIRPDKVETHLGLHLISHSHGDGFVPIVGAVQIDDQAVFLVLEFQFPPARTGGFPGGRARGQGHRFDLHLRRVQDQLAEAVIDGDESNA